MSESEEDLMDVSGVVHHCMDNCPLRYHEPGDHEGWKAPWGWCIVVSVTLPYRRKSTGGLLYMYLTH